MAHSLTPECTPLKHEYDACFNAWFEGYLQPAVNAASLTDEQRVAYSRQKAEEYEQKCGKVWESYKNCVQKAVKDKGLEDMLAEATKDDPLLEPPVQNGSS
ncbi:hypothetical protein SCHPADRAFT_823664 [Schizopora paradoxa]|uniref:Uncharacterized protein n=1 Tax=Schizopora paradoxa TaxID=27342 RepID=A0A0H2S2X3_9AGAM|nr:hypothetical protein SCHPADRAFT_823664 [Schizopora paradoxa]